MAILKISELLLITQPTLIDVLDEYFDSMEELTKDNPSYYRYAVQKDGLPKDNTLIDCIIDRDDNGNLRVVESKLR